MSRLILQACLFLALTVPLYGTRTAIPAYSRNGVEKPPAATTVLICGGRSSYAYHAYACHGLARCRSAISRVSADEARSKGYAPCKICHQ